MARQEETAAFLALAHPVERSHTGSSNTSLSAANHATTMAALLPLDLS